MATDTELLPSMREVCDALTRNRREHHRLRALQRLILHATDDRQQTPERPRQSQEARA